MTRRTVIAVLIWLSVAAQPAAAQRLVPTFFPEQRSIIVRAPSQLVPSRLPDSLPPSTVSNPQPELQPVQLSLDDMIRMSLGNVDVVRILAGTTATNSGRTIYDPAITNTAIDQQNAQFDPTLSVSNTWNRMENPQAIIEQHQLHATAASGRPSRREPRSNRAGSDRHRAFVLPAQGLDAGTRTRRD